MRQRVIYACAPNWAAAARQAELLMAAASFEPVKDEAKTRAGFVALADGTEVFIKRFDSGSYSRGLWARIRGSRARRSIRGARLLTACGFRCPAPYAALETLRAGSIRASYLLSEPLRQAQVASAFVGPRRRRGTNFLRRRRILNAVAMEIRRLHDARLFSSDLQETNLMLEDADGGFRIYFVDLDGFRRPLRVGWRMRERNLIQLDRSLGRFIGRSTRLRFLYTYLGGKPERREARQLVGRILARWAREERRSVARRMERQLRASAAAESLSAD